MVTNTLWGKVMPLAITSWDPALDFLVGWLISQWQSLKSIGYCCAFIRMYRRRPLLKLYSSSGVFLNSRARNYAGSKASFISMHRDWSNSKKNDDDINQSIFV